MSYQYRCIGSEAETINLPVISGKNIVAVLVDGLNVDIVGSAPTNDGEVLADENRGDLTLNYIPERGLNILVIVKNKYVSETTELIDFAISDFSSDDFY